MLLLLALIGPVICLFSETSHNFHVSEEAPVGSLIGRVPLQDGIVYRPSGLPSAIRLQNDELYVNEPLDREQYPLFSLSLVSNNPPAIIHVSVILEDVNDNAPSFPLSFQNISVLETASVGTRLPLVGAVDPDEGDNGRIVDYRLEGRDEELFKLVEEDGLIFLELEKSLDREENALYSFNLTANDGGSPHRTGLTTVYIQVLDVNDCAPEFPDRTTIANWNGQLSVPIMSLNAVDGDEGDNARIHYELLGQSQDFRIEENQLFAKVSSPACCQVSPCSECALSVRATDGGNPPLSSSTEIIVKFHDDNQHDPEIHIRLQPSHVDFAVISSEAEVDKAIAVLTVTDEDGPIGESGYLKLFDDEGLFVLNIQPSFSILRLAVPGNNLTQSEYHVLFEAADGQLPPRVSRKSLTVYHEGKKTNQKKSVQMTVRIREDLQKGSFVVQIGANSTADRFKFAETKVVLPLELDKINGIVTTSAESLSPGRLTFDVTLFPPPPAVHPSIVTVDLLIEDVNNHSPVIHIQQELELSENTSVGAKILDFEVSDKDLASNGKATVQIIEGEEYLKITGNSLFLKKKLDYESIKRFDVVLEAVDHGKPSLSTRKCLAIFVTDVNDNAPFFPCPEYHFTVSVSSPIRSEVGRVEATDIDSISKLSYFLLDPTLLFAINPNNGVISALRDLEPRTYKLLVAAKDEGGLISNNATVFIHSTGLPLPAFSKIPGSVEIKSLKEGDVVMRLTGSNIMVGSDIVTVGSSGSIKLNRIPSKPRFSVPFKQEIDGLTTSKCVQFERKLLPPFPNFNKKLELNLTIATPFGYKLKKLEACEQCDYSTDCPFLSIDSRGVLTLSRLFTTDKMMCSVLVKDELKREERIEVVVRKGDLGEEFRLPGYFEFFLDPDLKLGTIIGHLPTSPEHFYAVKKPGDIGVFPDGVLYVRRRLRQKEVYSFAVEAIHRKLGNRHRAEVWVRTLGSFATNLDCPRANFSIKENKLAGTTIGFLNSPHSVKIKQLDSLDKLLITSIGRIIALTEFDAEDVRNITTRFELIKGNAKVICSLLLKIQDENEFPPIFEKKFYSASFQFGNVSGTIGSVKAADTDRDSIGVIYKLTSHQQYFKINQTTGELSTLSLLPSDSFLNVSIRASDSGKPPRFGLTFFLITVEEGPAFPVRFLDNSTIRISTSTSVGSVVGRVVAVSGQRTLRIHSGDKRFLVDSFGFIKQLAKAEDLPKKFEVDFSTHGVVQRRTIIVSDTIVVKSVPSVIQSVSPTATISLTSPSNTAIKISNGSLFVNKTMREEQPLGNFQILLETKGSYSLVNVAVEDETDRPPQCGSNVFLIDQLPETLKINCWADHALKYEGRLQGLRVHKDGSIRIDKLDDVVTQLDVEMETRKQNHKIALVFIRNKTDSSISFSSDNFTLLLSSSLQNGQSFGRVAAESDSHLNYYFLGTDTLSVKKDSGELIVMNITDIRLNPEPRVVTLIAANRVGISTVQIKIEIVEDTLFLPRNTFIFEAKNRLTGSLVGEMDLGRKDVTLESLDDRIFIREQAMYLKSSVQNDTKSLLKVNVEARKGRISSKLTVFIILPVTKGTLQFQVTENLSRGTIIGEIPEGLVLADKPNFIELDRTTRLLKTTEIFDRETIQNYYFTLKTRAGDQLFAQLVVEDENDNAPNLEKNTIELTVSEDCEIGAALTRIRFTDLDLGDMFHFIIEEGNELEQFSVDRWGLIKLEKPLDYEENRAHRLRISLKDGLAPFNYHTVECEVVITVLDVNDTPPHITSSLSFTVPEDSLVGTSFATLTALDPDSLDLLFRILPNSLPYAEFLIDPITGLLQINKELDYERKKTFEFLVEVSDGELSSSTAITVTALDKNDNPPRFVGNETVFTVKETASVGEVVALMDITDLDGEDNSRCTFWISEDSKSFQIGENDGIIVVAGKLDYETTKVHQLVVYARNIADGTAIISRNVSIRIEDENDEPPRFVKGSPQILEVFENLPWPAVISTSVCEDGDKDDPIAYSLLRGNTSLFSVDVNTGDILLLGPLDREEADNHQLTILAKDSSAARKFTEAEIMIRVLDDNDHAPSFLQPYYQVQLTENTPNGTKVLQVVAQDPDLQDNGEISYGIVEKNVPFVINRATGVIRVNGVIDREERNQWEITVEARDGGRFGSHSTLVTVSITIDDQNDNFPVILNSQMDIFIDAKSQKGEVIHVVDSLDPDLDNIQFSLSGTDVKSFDITKNGEVISLIESLLMKSFYTLTVTAEDTAGHTASSTFTFYVDDAIFPVFSPIGPIQIAENTVDTVAVFRATTQKAKNKIQYSILSGNDGSFEIGPANGVLKIVKPLDRERKDFHKIWVKATDSDSPPKSRIQSVEIRVLDQNDNKPQFSQPLYRTSVKENEEPGEILAVKAFDEDLGKNAVVSYSIQEGNEDGLFSINLLGRIRNLRPLDREVVSTYRLTIRATDSGQTPLFRDAVVVIDVEDEDDNSPKFTRIFHAEIPEDMEIGSEVVLVTATDSDESSSHNFSLEDSDDTFVIERTTGMITLRKELDREKIPFYRLRVRLDDGVWTIWTSVQITVTDINDNSPIFQQLYIFTTRPASNTIGQVTAVDADEEVNGHVSYYLSINHPEIVVDPETGQLSSLRPLTKPMEMVTIVARDSGIPSRSSNATVWVLNDYQTKPVMLLAFHKSAKKGDVVWKIPSSTNHVLSSPYFNLINGKLILSTDANLILPLPSAPIGPLVHVEEGVIYLSGLAVKLLDTPFLPPKYLSNMVKLTVSDETLPGTRLGSMSVKTEAWIQYTVDNDIIVITEAGDIVLKKELDNSKEYRVTVNATDLNGRTDSATLILKPSVTAKHSFDQRFHPVLFFGSDSICSPFSDDILAGSIQLYQDSCILINGSVPETVTFFISEKGVTVPVFDVSTSPAKSQPDVLSITVNSTINGTRLYRIERAKNCTLLEESGLRGYSLTQDFLEVCGVTNRGREERIFVARKVCKDRFSFVDLRLSPDWKTELIPRVVHLRENSPSQIVAKLKWDRDQHSWVEIADAEMKKLFKIEENILSSLFPLDRELKSFYSVPLKSSNGHNFTLKVLIDDILDSPAPPNKDLSIIVFGQIRKVAVGSVHPASLDTVHAYSCTETDTADYRTNSNCQITINHLSEVQPTLPVNASLNNSNVLYSLKFSQKKLRRLRFDSAALNLNLFGTPDGIAILFSKLHSEFPDLKFYPIAVQTKAKYFHSLVMGLADRHDKVVTIEEAQSVIDSCLASHPALELLPRERSACSNYSMKVITSGRHLGFRGVDSLWFLPEGRIETRCIHENVPEVPENISIKKKPASCSKNTCPGICSLEQGKVVCLTGDEKNVCGDHSAISLEKGHLDLIPTQLFISRQGANDCNDSSISIEFKSQTDGVLLSVENFQGFRSSLEISGGVPVYRITDGYRTPVEVPLTKSVSDQKWHVLTFKMTDNGRRILLEVDGMGREARTKKDLPLVFSEELKQVQIGAGTHGKRFNGCLRRVVFNEYEVPLHGSTEEEPLFSISAVGHISWSNRQTHHSRLSPTSLFVIAAISALIAVVLIVYGCSRMYFRLKTDKGPAWQETRDIDVRHLPPKNSSTSTSDDSHIYERPQIQETSFERAPTLPIRKIRTVADVTLAISRTNTPKYYRNDGYA